MVVAQNIKHYNTKLNWYKIQIGFGFKAHKNFIKNITIKNISEY